MAFSLIFYIFFSVNKNYHRNDCRYLVDIIQRTVWRSTHLCSCSFCVQTDQISHNSWTFLWHLGIRSSKQMTEGYIQPCRLSCTSDEILSVEPSLGIFFKLRMILFYTGTAISLQQKNRVITETEEHIILSYHRCCGYKQKQALYLWESSKHT